MVSQVSALSAHPDAAVRLVLAVGVLDPVRAGLQQCDALDVRGLREYVDRAHPTSR